MEKTFMVNFLAELLKRLTELNWSENRIRILYTHPAHFNDKLINCLAENELFAAIWIFRSSISIILF